MDQPPDIAPAENPESRRRPQQARSRQKVEAILDAAALLIGEKGIDGVAMRDIARAIDAPLSVIYQYFPNKSAIVGMLFSRFTENTRAETAAAVARIASKADFLAAVDHLLERYVDAVRSQPVIADVINAVLADKKLQHLDIEDSRWHAAALVEAGRDLVRPERQAEFARVAFLLNHLIGGLMQLMLAVEEDEAHRLLEDYKHLARQQLLTTLK